MRLNMLFTGWEILYRKDGSKAGKNAPPERHKGTWHDDLVHNPERRMEAVRKPRETGKLHVDCVLRSNDRKANGRMAPRFGTERTGRKGPGSRLGKRQKIFQENSNPPQNRSA